MGDGERAEKYYWEDLELAALHDVYLPAEDSELIAIEALKIAGGRVLEIGTGSGIVSIACAKKKEVVEVVATDISPSALSCAKGNAKKNGAKIRFFLGDLFAALPKGIGKFDLIIFNPPYLPTGADEKVHGRLNDALDGGKEGIEVPLRFLKGAKKFLAKNGTVLMVASTEQNLKKMMAGASKCGFSVEVAATHNLFFEQLQVWKMQAKK